MRTKTIMRNCLPLQKLKNKWLGPYKIREIVETVTYLLNELDGMQLDGIFIGDRMKKSFARYRVEDNVGEVPEEIVEEVEELDKEQGEIVDVELDMVMGC